MKLEDNLVPCSMHTKNSLYSLAHFRFSCYKKTLIQEIEINNEFERILKIKTLNVTP